MKNWLFFNRFNIGFLCFAIAISVMAINGCSKIESTPSEQKRIQLKEYTVLKGHAFFIISIDGREFATAGDGGLYPLDK